MPFKSWAIQFAFMSFGSLFLAPLAHGSQDCTASCPGAASDKVVIDVSGKCMCIGDGDCFKVDIGITGPEMTTEGASETKLEGCHGDKYTEASRPNDGYDNDCLRMGIPGNDHAGKWIHKTQLCGPGGANATLGCIGVPCNHWTDLIENAKNKMSVVVCNGRERKLGDGRRGLFQKKYGSETGSPEPTEDGNYQH